MLNMARPGQAMGLAQQPMMLPPGSMAPFPMVYGPMQAQPGATMRPHAFPGPFMMPGVAGPGMQISQHMSQQMGSVAPSTDLMQHVGPEGMRRGTPHGPHGSR